METCKNCGNDKFEKAVQFAQVKKKKSSLSGSDVELIFCAKCGEVAKLTVMNPEKVS